MRSAKRSGSRVAAVSSVAAVVAGALVACGARVVVDGEASGVGGSVNDAASVGAGAGRGVGGAGATTSSGGSGSSTGSAGGGGVIQVPTGTSDDCSGVVYDLVMNLEGLIGCTPFASPASGVQCSGKYVLHDPCGCPHIINESTEDGHATNDDTAYDGCVEQGCCGPQLQGCGPCEALPAVGHCDGFTSRCVPGP